jgi:hypothetical protein
MSLPTSLLPLDNNDCVIRPKDLVRELGEVFTQGIKAWVRAGEIVVKLIDDFGYTVAAIADDANNPILTPATVSKFEQIGRRQILPELVIANYPAAKYLARLPISEQTRLTDGGGKVELLVDNNGITDTLLVSARDMTGEQCKQAFGAASVLALPAQRAKLAERPREARVSPGAKYRIVKGEVIFMTGEPFAAKELLAIVQAIAK